MRVDLDGLALLQDYEETKDGARWYSTATACS